MQFIVILLSTAFASTPATNDPKVPAVQAEKPTVFVEFEQPWSVTEFTSLDSDEETSSEDGSEAGEY